MECMKTDFIGESNCDSSYKKASEWNFQCGHECVRKLHEENIALNARLKAAEEKLRKYRDAIRPFMDNCRACVQIADEIEKKEDGK